MKTGPALGGINWLRMVWIPVFTGMTTFYKSIINENFFTVSTSRLHRGLQLGHPFLHLSQRICFLG